MSQLGRPTSFHRPEGSGARNMNERICLIVNPTAGAGKAGMRLHELEQAVDRAFAKWELRVTEGPGHGTQIAAQCTDEDFQIVAAVGGDGTCHEVVNGLFHEGKARRRNLIFSVIPFGTGSDLVRTLRTPRALNEALWVAATGITLPSDVGRIRMTTAQGEIDRTFLNVAGFGANGDAAARANRMDKRLGGRLTFLRASLATAAQYTPSRLRITWEGPDGPGEHEGTVLSCFIANAAHCGGGMKVGRAAGMQDGALDMTILPPASLPRMLVETRRLYDGSLHKFPGAVQARITHIEAQAIDGGDVFLEADGEVYGTLPMSIDVIPGALQIRGGWVHNPHLEERASRI
jgi:YegS/Rv2252/BmrU family lipid kinase